jgi:CubicO group peptidase (beta-lactamase class C family)
VAVIAGGEVLLARGYGVLSIESEALVTADTPFMVASISKVVTATALMQLVEGGDLNINEPINNLLPFGVDNPRTEDEIILLRQLLTHTSGIRDRNNLWGELGDADALYVPGDSPIALGDFMEGYLVADGEWYREANFYPLMPDVGLRYSNIAFALAGHIVETVSGTPLDDHCDASIFSTLNMANTGWHLADFDVDTVAVPHSGYGGDRTPYGHYGYPDYPDGQLRSSAADLARFLLAFDQGGALDGGRILEESTVDQMWTPQVPEVDDTQGLGWYWWNENGVDGVGHEGADYGVATQMFLDVDSGVGVIVLANVDWSSATTPAIMRISERLFEAGLSR